MSLQLRISREVIFRSLRRSGCFEAAPAMLYLAGEIFLGSINAIDLGGPLGGTIGHVCLEDVHRPSTHAICTCERVHVDARCRYFSFKAEENDDTTSNPNHIVPGSMRRKMNSCRDAYNNSKTHIQRHPYSSHDSQTAAHSWFSRPGAFIRQSQRDAQFSLGGGRLYNNTKTNFHEDTNASLE